MEEYAWVGNRESGVAGAGAEEEEEGGAPEEKEEEASLAPSSPDPEGGTAFAGGRSARECKLPCRCRQEEKVPAMIGAILLPAADRCSPRSTTTTTPPTPFAWQQDMEAKERGSARRGEEDVVMRELVATIAWCRSRRRPHCG